MSDPWGTVSFVLPRVFDVFRDKNWSESKQSTRFLKEHKLNSYKTTEWMIYKVLSLYYLHLFPRLAAVSLQGYHENRCFLAVLAWGFMFVSEDSSLFSSPKVKTRSISPPSVTPLFHHALITFCNVSRAGYNRSNLQMYHDRVHLILFKAMWPRINQWKPLFSWMKV